MYALAVISYIAAINRCVHVRERGGVMVVGVVGGGEDNYYIPSGLVTAKAIFGGLLPLSLMAVKLML